MSESEGASPGGSSARRDPRPETQPRTLVVDTGVAAKWYLNEPFEDEATRMLEAAQRGDVRLVAPDSMPPELFNVLWSYHVGRRGSAPRLSLKEVREHWASFSGAPVELYRTARRTPRAVELAIEIGVIVYDTLFLALAEVADGVLVTVDERSLLKRIEGTPHEHLAVHLADVKEVPPRRGFARPEPEPEEPRTGGEREGEP